MMAPMSREQVRQLAQERTMTSVVTLGRAIGTGSNKIYDDIAQGRWTATRVIRIGRKILIPTADIVALVEGQG